MSNNYEEVVIFPHEHYKNVKKTHNMLLAIEDKQQQATRIRLLVQEAAEQGVSPRGVQVSRHGRRGAVEAPEQADS
ncbi:MAG: hypothetical protein ACKPKO_05305, partial [Candidatus Fonsibacter sp.]